MKGFIVIVMLHFVLVSCAEQDQLEGAVARVNDRYLFKEEIDKLAPSYQSVQDSILWRNSYIKTWATRELLYEKALINVSNQDQDIEELVENYRRELLIDRYKRAVLQQELDTVVTEADLDTYYELNKNVYRLNEELLRLRFIHFSLDMNDRKELVKKFRSSSVDDAEDLEERSLEFYALSLTDSIWVSRVAADDKLPWLKEEKRLKKDQFIQKEDSLGVYLVAIKEVLHRNDVAPKSYVIPTIRQMILHNRKLELMNEIEKTLVIDAINNKQFEQY